MASNWKLLTVSYGRKIILLALLLNIDVCLGASLVLSGSSPSAVCNQSFTLTCIVPQASDINDRVLFLKTTTVNEFASLLQNMATCVVFNPAPSDYSASCGDGTDSSSSTTKKYSLEINRVADGDTTDWWCKLDNAKKYSNMFSLTFITSTVPSPESQVSESSIIIIVVVAVLLVVAIAVSWFCYKRMKQQPKSKEEQTENKTQEAEDEKGQDDK
ncbi:uncharacterized protein LOC121386665 [Gigantopelta aegis]|uniref:uncharacterized protein LOC121386665 n=1 Tax=Gigantopelta aegis TaxID=1735272 RepID=UPI001B88ABA5|nr:uncharacterized protein LOC121386665 [Gigantopelta aegis]